MARGLHYNDDDITEWRARTNPAHPNYVVGNSVNQGWTNIIARADEFKVAPLNDIYTGVTRSITEAVLKGDTPMPNGSPTNYARHAQSAGLVYLLTGNATYAAAVRQLLLAQILEPKLDFSNTTHWTNQNTADGPFWGICEWLVRLLHSFDYIKGYLSAGEKASIETWFYNAGSYFHTMLWSMFSNKFLNESDRNNSIMVDDYGGAVNSSDPYDFGGTQVYTHRDSGFTKYNPITYGNSWFHNRSLSVGLFVGLAGIYFNEQNWINNAKYLVKNNICLQMFPDGTNAEALRATTDSNTEAAFFYTASIYSYSSLLAHALYRIGDNELYSFITSHGWYSTTGGSKSLRLGWQTIVRYREKRMLNGGNPGTAFTERSLDNDPTNEIDGYSPGWEGTHLTWSALANMYYKDSEIEAGYKMTNLGGYPSSPMAGNVSYMMQGALLPDVLFMWGDRQYNTMRQTKILLENDKVKQTQSSVLTLSGTTNIVGNLIITTGGSLQISGTGNTMPYVENTTFNAYTGETQSTLSDITIEEGLTQSPSTVLNLSGISMVTITLTGNTIVSGVTNVSAGACIVRYIHSGYTLTLLGKTNFKNYLGSYLIRITNTGTAGVSNIVPVDLVSTNESDVLTIINTFDIASKLDSDLGSTDWRTGTGSGGNLIAYTVLDPTEIKTIYSTPIQLKANPGSGITDNVRECWAYVDYKGVAYTGNTTLVLKSGSKILGTCNCLSATTSGWYKFTLTGTSEINAALTVTSLSGNPSTGGTNNVGVSVFYNQLSQSSFTFPAYDYTTLGTTAPLTVSVSTTIRPRGQYIVMAADGFIDSISLRHSTPSGTTQVGIYTDSGLTPNTLVASSSSGESAATSGYQVTTHALTTPYFAKKGTKLWIGWVYQSATDTQYYAGYGTSALQTASGYPLPSTFGAFGSPTLHYTVYANVRYEQGTYNYILNDNFQYNWADPTVPDGYTKQGTHDANNKVEENANGMRFVADGSVTCSIRKAGILVSGQTYFCEIDIHSVAVSGVFLLGTSQIATAVSAGKSAFKFVADGVNFSFSRYSGGGDLVIKGMKIWQ